MRYWSTRIRRKELPISDILFKFGDQLVKTTNWLLLGAMLLILLALFTHRRWPLWLGTIVLGVYLVFSFVPLGEWPMVPLENRFSARYEYPERADGIVVISERLAGEIATARGALMMPNEPLMREAEFSRRYPDARLILTGIGESTSAHSMPMGDVVRDYLAGLGVDPSRVELEVQARSNPHDTVMAAHTLASPKPEETWLLVGVAAEMPRAVGVARKLGWRVTPVPIAYRTDGRFHSLAPHLRPTYYLWMVDSALAEWLGLLKYYWSGEIDELFPAPER